MNTPRFETLREGGYTFEYDNHDHSLRLSWSGDQCFMGYDEAVALFGFLANVLFDHDPPPQATLIQQSDEPLDEIATSMKTPDMEEDFEQHMWNQQQQHLEDRAKIGQFGDYVGAPEYLPGQGHPSVYHSDGWDDWT